MLCRNTHCVREPHYGTVSNRKDTRVRGPRSTTGVASVVITPNDPLRDFRLLATRAPRQKPWFPEEHTLAAGPLTTSHGCPFMLQTCLQRPAGREGSHHCGGTSALDPHQNTASFAQWVKGRAQEAPRWPTWISSDGPLFAKSDLERQQR